MERKSLQAEAGGEIGYSAAVEIAGAYNRRTARRYWHARGARRKTNEAGVAGTWESPVQEGDVPAVSVRATIVLGAVRVGSSCWEISFILGIFFLELCVYFIEEPGSVLDYQNSCFKKYINHRKSASLNESNF